MSLRRKRISIPEKVNATILNNTLELIGPKGKLELSIPELVSIEITLKAIFLFNKSLILVN
jgi:ribosomal protein L6P/L9E